MEFSYPAPGALTPAGSDYYGHWSVASSNHGYSASEVASWVHSALHTADGLTQIPISFVQESIGSGDGVVFSTVADLPGNAIGTAYLTPPPGVPYVELKSSYYGNLDLVNHEAIHAFLYASHSPEGSVSIMEPLEDPGEEGLSDSDVAEIRAHLGIEGSPGPPQALPPQLYWHPLNLEHYITKVSLADVTEVEVTVPVRSVRRAGLEPGNTLKAVWALDLSDMDPSSWTSLGASVTFDEPGFYASGFQAIDPEAKSAGEVYVGMTIETGLPIDELAVGQAELRAK